MSYITLQSRTTQSGSVAQFVIVAVVLALALVGIVYAVNRYSGDMSADTSTQNTTDQSPSTTADEKQANEQAATAAAKAEQEKKAEAAKKEQEAQAAANTSAESTPDNGAVLPSARSTGESTAQGTAQLPVTGPLSFGSAFAGILALLSYIVGFTMYRRSRHAQNTVLK